MARARARQHTCAAGLWRPRRTRTTPRLSRHGSSAGSDGPAARSSAAALEPNQRSAASRRESATQLLPIRKCTCARSASGRSLLGGNVWKRRNAASASPAARSASIFRNSCSACIAVSCLPDAVSMLRRSSSVCSTSVPSGRCRPAAKADPPRIEACSSERGGERRDMPVPGVRTREKHAICCTGTAPVKFHELLDAFLAYLVLRPSNGIGVQKESAVESAV